MSSVDFYIVEFNVRLSQTTRQDENVLTFCLSDFTSSFSNVFLDVCQSSPVWQKGRRRLNVVLLIAPAWHWIRVPNPDEWIGLDWVRFSVPPNTLQVWGAFLWVNDPSNSVKALKEDEDVRPSMSKMTITSQ